MEFFLEILQQYGPYVGLAVIIAGVVQALKKAFKKFLLQNYIGMRLLPFIPIVLGLAGGLLLPLESVREQLLVGGALGTVSSLIYKIVTVSLASKLRLIRKMENKNCLG